MPVSALGVRPQTLSQSTQPRTSRRREHYAFVPRFLANCCLRKMYFLNT